METRIAYPEQATPPVPKPASSTSWLGKILPELKQEFWGMFDLGLSFAIGVIAFPFFAISAANYLPFSWTLFLGTSLTYVFSHIFGLHELSIINRRSTLISKSLYTAILTNTALGSIAVVVFFEKIPINYLLCHSALLFFGMVLTRILFWDRLNSKPPLTGIVGPLGFCQDARCFISSKANPENLSLSPDDGEDNLDRWIRETRPDLLILPDQCPGKLLEFASAQLNHGLKVIRYSDFIESNYYIVPIHSIELPWFFSNSIQGTKPHIQYAKRAFDLFISVIGLLASLPVILVAAILIRLSDHGPIFYSQTRVGLNHRHFKIYKLRTMRTNAESGGPAWAKKNDSRTTRIGAILRKTRIDELPQFWNILKGDMSFVGPRPERPVFFESLGETIPFFDKRTLVKPGLTGWAQINYPYGASEADSLEKLQYDLFYIKHASPLFDLRIIIRTIGTVMQGSR